ncbi:hypothetical protein H4P12_10275 [Paracoccus sp. 11-3]|uniref:Uncharacterized protein n=1 Tax=Paracoccus amoyensis TaxID=2760093 RepID=A0A926GEJ5_9RHOB|nr:hypothetical protein [Paracoccus amoyensis]MBC9247096.1 hypothetical protein [Paracoccus amoyensis]
MIGREIGWGALAALTVLAGCGSTGTQSVNTPVAGASTTASAAFNAERRGLSHIGLRDCGSYRLDLFAPTRLNTAKQSDGAIYLRAYTYGAGGPVQMRIPASAARLQRQTGGAWQDVPMTASAMASAASVAASGGVVSTPIAQQLAQPTPLPAGQYRLWSGQFAAQRSGGAACALSPLWQFTVE